MSFQEKQEWFICVNPAAGGGRCRQEWEKMKPLLTQSDINYDVRFTEGKGHAISLVADAIREGYRKIIAVGGDGTNNEAANGIVSQKEVPLSEIRYTLIPVGTGNDWIRTHKIPKDWKKWIPIIKNENLFAQDVGRVDYLNMEGEEKTRYFMNVAGMAYDAFIARAAEESKGGASNKLIYLSLIVTCLFKYNLRKAVIKYNGEEVTDKFYTINLGICKYSGGGMSFVPHAVANDGQMALTYAVELSKLGVILATPKFYNGKVEKHRKITCTHTKEVVVEAKENSPTLLEVDGEFLGRAPAKFTVLEKALNIIVP